MSLAVKEIRTPKICHRKRLVFGLFPERVLMVLVREYADNATMIPIKKKKRDSKTL